MEEAEIKIIKKVVLWFIGIVVTLSFILWLCTTTVNVAKTAIIRYEEYLEIYQTCERINTDLCNMKQLPDNDKMFEQFSKGQRILALKTQLNRWVEDYNAKSKMINRSLWKSSELPYQLTVTQFNCN